MSNYIGVSTLKGIKGVWLKESDRRVLVFAGAVIENITDSDAAQLGDMVKPLKSKFESKPVATDKPKVDEPKTNTDEPDGMSKDDVDGLLEGNAVDVTKAVANIDSKDDLNALMASEKTGKQRSTVMTAIKAKIDSL